ncbi:carboxymuconolactone decarboxylase family protein [Acanthopleuribacter pedis]|uniref:Alkyl hydroperoxide reductase AhpD n=1 Tax=Acanthopleuribacter pedis TaxID=442870 RepID=A0A8J7QPH8_9BACT|nr:carboxymuconolactone decarboxylase family protein [Acanthopleuribacter pedis]MBO1321730.1 carboxymuconolactone decarboxylase family protein [Acanthopleuribacter pedis]
MTTATASAIQELAARLPEAARDIKVNFKNIFNGKILDAKVTFGVALSIAYNESNNELIEALVEEGRARDVLDEATIEDAKAAAALMSMNNVYYRFRHLVGKEAYSTMPARLRMQRIGKPATEKTTFELFSLAVSAVNGCGMCMESHEAVLVKHGVSEEAIHEAVRIAAITRATSVSLGIPS